MARTRQFKTPTDIRRELTNLYNDLKNGKADLKTVDRQIKALNALSISLANEVKKQELALKLQEKYELDNDIADVRRSVEEGRAR